MGRATFGLRTDRDGNRQGGEEARVGEGGRKRVSRGAQDGEEEGREHMGTRWGGQMA